MDGESVDVRIIETIASLEGVDPVEMSPPLYDVIDPEALNSLLSSGDRTDARSPITVEFTYNGYSVTVDSAGEIDVTELRDVRSTYTDVEGTLGD